MSYPYLSVGRSTDLPAGKSRSFYRFLEILPGALAWLTLFAVVALSYWAPIPAAIFIIVFDIYWLIKTVYLSLHMSHSFQAMRANQTCFHC